MSRENVSTDFKFGDSDAFMLTDIDTDESISMIPCDTAGNFSWTGVTRAPLTRNALQTSNTSNQYSDLERPWISIPQEDWTGGRGNDIFTKDTTRYRDGKRAQASFNQVIYNGPLDYYSKGFRSAETNCPGSLKWKKMMPDAEKYIAVKVTPDESFDAGELYIHVRRRGTPTAPLIVELCESLEQDATVYATHSYTTAEITDTLAEFLKFTFAPVTLSAGEACYIRIHSEYGNTDNYWEVGIKSKFTGITYYSPDGITYNTANYDIYYRLAETQTDFETHFFIYEQLAFMVRQKIGETPTLWLNGDIGKITSVSGTTITDSSKSWATNAYAGARIGLVYKHGAEEHATAWRTIVSNTATAITVDKAWEIAPQANCEYIINDTPLWHEITGHGLTSFVTDIHVIKGVVYFAQGDYLNARKMRWNNGSFEWVELTGITASFLQSVRDSSGMMLYRGRNDDGAGRRVVDRSRLLDWDITHTWTKVTQAITTKEPTPQKENITTKTETTGTGDDQKIKVTETASYAIGDPSQEYQNSVAVTRISTDTDTTTSGGSGSGSSGSSSGTGHVIYDIGDDGYIYVGSGSSGSSGSSGTTSETTKTRTETYAKTTTKTPRPLRTSIVTEAINFGTMDCDAVQYIVQIDNFESENFTGKCLVTLQESEDGLAYHDVQSVTAIGTGLWYIFAHCQYPYRRFQITALGTNATINNITISTSIIPHFEDPIILRDNFGKITRLFEYGAEMTKSLWIVQEGMLSSINKVEGTTDTYTHDRINLDELQTTAEMHNGKAMATADVYLLWGWLNGLQRYYNTQLEGKGPDHDEGLPFDRQGRTSQIISYPSNFFISIDGGDTGYSCVMQFNQSGWHEIYRAPNVGERILDMAFQPIYGSRPDRLWLNVGDDVIWLTMPSKILYAIQDQNAEYTHESVLISSWHTAGMMDIEKLWQTLKIMADYLDGKNCWVEADYQTDEEREWHPIKNWYVVSPSQKEELSPNSSVNGKKLRYRLRLQSTDMHKTPKVNVVVLEAVGRVDIKMSYNFYFRNIKHKRDLNAEFEDVEPLDVQDVLDRWANDLKKLRLNSRWKIFDDKLVYLDAVQTSVLNELSEGYIGQITLNEL